MNLPRKKIRTETPATGSANGEGLRKQTEVRSQESLVPKTLDLPAEAEGRKVFVPDEDSNSSDSAISCAEEVKEEEEVLIAEGGNLSGSALGVFLQKNFTDFAEAKLINFNNLNLHDFAPSGV